eukprot:3451280-Amphidinium_carterae.1
MASSSVPTARPSAAPEIENLLTLLDSAEDPVYTPIMTPEEPQMVESESPCIPDFMLLTVLDSLDYLLVPLDEVVEFSAQSLHSRWTADSEHDNYA